MPNKGFIRNVYIDKTYREQIGNKMQRKTQTIPKATVARILFNAGAKRVSQKAVSEFSDIIDDIAMEIGKKAIDIAKHSGRKTVQEGDVKLAAK
ncbi:MAG: histone family protein [Candidatus Woesearchaeota archaeon]